MARNGRNPGQTREQQPGQGEFELNDDTIRNLQAQLNESIQPVIQNLQQQIVNTVQRRMSQQESTGQSANGASSAPGLDSLGQFGEYIQQAIDYVMEIIRRVMAWLRQQLEALGDKVAEAIGSLAGQIVQRAVRSAF